jgi:DNA-binding NarL/FixJ family response regulator
MAEMVRVVLADDHPLIRSGLRSRLEEEPGISIVGEASHGDMAMRACQDLQPDVLVLDLNMPGPPATSIVSYVHVRCPEMRVLVLTAYDDDAYVRGLVAAGISGYVLKDEAPDALVDAVKSVANGGTWFSRAVVAKLVRQPDQARSGPHLTPREQELLDLLGRGWDNWRLANELHLSEQTVRNYLSRLYSKLGVQTRAGAIVWARDHGVEPRRNMPLNGN